MNYIILIIILAIITIVTIIIVQLNGTQDTITIPRQLNPIPTLRPQNQITTLSPQNQITTLRPQNQITTLSPQNQTTTLSPQNQTTTLSPQNQTTKLTTQNQTTQSPQNQTTQSILESCSNSYCATLEVPKDCNYAMKTFPVNNSITDCSKRCFCSYLNWYNSAIGINDIGPRNSNSICKTNYTRNDCVV
jgi:hypothetical protein